MKVADKQISSLPQAQTVDDASLFVLEQQGIAMKASGAQWKGYAQSAVSQYVTQAQQQAQAAADSAADAAQSAQEAEQSAQDAADSAESAKDYSGKPPTIIDGKWWIWDAEQQKYVDSGEAARGNVMYATFEVEMDTGDLIMTTPDEYMGPEFSIDENGHLEVSINA